MLQTSRRDFVIRLASLAAVAGSGAALTACGGGDDVAPSFSYGVASGDPLADRVMLWTHAQYDGVTDDVALTWEVATDAAFATLTASGSARAVAAAAFTVKVDATGLSAGKDYFFRFRAGAYSSPVGRTRTLPAAGAASLSMAVMSCSNYPAGYFNAYAEVTRTDARYAVHLGDFIYEYGAGGYASADAVALGRVSDPANECLSLSDYRKRYAQYRSDPDSKVFHAAMPVIAVWDDHEIANDIYKDGAENHTESTEGKLADRRAAALQAWHEWMPVRTPDATDLRKIYRSFDFGGLTALHMLETRLLARDKPVEFAELLNPATASAALATLSSTTRSLMGATQLGWLQGQMAASNATWQVLGQQVLMARMSFPVSVLSALNPSDTSPSALAAGQQAITDYLTAKGTAAANPAALTDAQKALLDPAKNPKLGYNLDAWDGYPVEREVLLTSAQKLGKKLVVLAGDTHNAWSSRLTLMDGTVVGQEFATPSISSPGLEAYLATLPPAEAQKIFLGVVDDLKYADTARRGFLRMTFTPTEAKGTWHFVSTIKSRTYTVDASASQSFSG
ncbi:MAG: alkaline phosphatase D family protein [Rhodoferax sp.]|uniref:alkaline phosphatase D family protein n=1 Tax=Rhodoferax sp. TaxID=50421 RepID=UPI003BB21C35